MPRSIRSSLTPLSQAAFVVLVSASAIAAQANSATMPPVNSLPNPYRTIEGWAKMPEGRTWGSTSAVAIDKDGQSIWVAERCGANSCATSQLDPVLKFDASGTFVKSFGAGLVGSPHGIFVDRENNVWVVDCSCLGGGGGRGRGAAGAAGQPATQPEGPPKGHQVFKFSPDGKLLMTLGKPGGGREAEYFTQPNAVFVAPNGDIYVAEGHSSNAASATARVFRFSKDGTLIKSWGQWGSGPDDFDQPHALAMDSRGRLFVGDRGNNRIKIFDQDGKLLDTWYQFSRPSGIYIDAQDNIYVADSESQSVSRTRTDWHRGMRIGSAKDGKVQYFIPDPVATCPQGQPSTAEAPCAPSTSAAEGVAVDSKGVIYGAEVGPRALKRSVKP
jgi:sugar lactone lactonase YvrE